MTLDPETVKAIASVLAGVGIGGLLAPKRYRVPGMFVGGAAGYGIRALLAENAFAKKKPDIVPETKMEKSYRWTSNVKNTAPLLFRSPMAWTAPIGEGSVVPVPWDPPSMEQRIGKYIRTKWLGMEPTERQRMWDNPDEMERTRLSFEKAVDAYRNRNRPD